MKVLIALLIVALLLVGTATAAQPMKVTGWSGGSGFVTIIGIPGDGVVHITKIIGNTTSIVNVPYKTVWCR
jgi:hypothetical protein